MSLQVETTIAIISAFFIYINISQWLHLYLRVINFVVLLFQTIPCFLSFIYSEVKLYQSSTWARVRWPTASNNLFRPVTFCNIFNCYVLKTTKWVTNKYKRNDSIKLYQTYIIFSLEVYNFTIQKCSRFFISLPN